MPRVKTYADGQLIISCHELQPRDFFGIDNT